MELFLSLIGILTVLFILLASINGLKPYVKVRFVKVLSKQHKIFGMAATILAVIHLSLAIYLNELRVTGLLALIGLILTGLSGILFYKLKQKYLYIMHRIFGPVAFVLVIVHIILNSNI